MSLGRGRQRSKGAGRWTRGAVTVAALAWAAAPAQAESTYAPSVGAEGALGTMLPSFQRDVLRYGWGAQSSLRAALALPADFEVQLGVRSWWFPSSAGYGRATLYGLGLRWAGLAIGDGHGFVELNGGPGLNGDVWRLMIDGAIGYELPLPALPPITLGPVLRLGEVVTSSSDVQKTPVFWSLGLGITWHFGGTGAVPVVVPPAAPPAASETSPAAKTPVAAPVPPEPPRDRDGDGVADAGDQCADIAAGPNPNPDHPGCPDGDDDRDGVFNHGDVCPTEPAGLHADAARPGCPLADRDKDSVPDADDHCPDKPGAPNPNPKKNGCPGLVMVTAEHLEIRKPVFFASKKDRILAKSNPVLQAVADALQATEAIRRISIEGHTDGQGAPAYNLDLSRRRAESVKAWLIAHGVAAARIEASGFGDTKPLTTNKTAAGRAANRRVEFVIVNASSMSSSSSPSLSASDPS